MLITMSYLYDLKEVTDKCYLGSLKEVKQLSTPIVGSFPTVTTTTAQRNVAVIELLLERDYEKRNSARVCLTTAASLPHFQKSQLLRYDHCSPETFSK